MRCDFI